MVITLLFYLTILIFSLGQMGRISFVNQQINFYLYEPFLLLNLGLLIVKFGWQPLVEGYRKIRILYFFLLILFFSYMINIFSFNLFQNTVSFLYYLRLIFYLGYWGYWGYLVKKQPEFRKTLGNGILIFIGLTLVASLIQFFLYRDLRNLIYLGWDPHLYRMFGVFFDTSVAGAIYGLIALYLIYNRRLLPAFLFSIFVLLTFSRSLYIVFTAMLVLFLMQKKLFKWILVLVLGLLIMVMALPKPFGEGVNLKRKFSIEARIEDYRVGLTLWQKKPVLGYGYNRIRYIKKQADIISHAGASFSSSFLIVLVTSGILGMLGFLGVLGEAAKINKLTANYIIFLSALSLTDNIILHPFVMFFLGSFIICSLVNPSRKLA